MRPLHHSLQATPALDDRHVKKRKTKVRRLRGLLLWKLHGYILVSRHCEVGRYQQAYGDLLSTSGLIQPKPASLAQEFQPGVITQAAPTKHMPSDADPIGYNDPLLKPVSEIVVPSALCNYASCSSITTICLKGSSRYIALSSLDSVT